MFTKFDKAIAALVLALLALLSVIFKSDLSGYGEAITGVLVALMPVVVYYVPNLRVLEDGVDPKTGAILDAVTEIGSKLPPKSASKPAPSAPSRF